MNINLLLPLLLGWLADRLFGDPRFLPHPAVGFGKVISSGERALNKGNRRMLKGGLFAILLISLCFLLMYFLLQALAPYCYAYMIFSAIVIFFCLAGKTLIDEVKQVFVAVDSSVSEGRTQVARIVGRDTSALSPQQIRTAALETLAENLSDGVIAPLFWYVLLGVPGMFAYKMVNTLDSMIGYKNERYRQFGCWAAHIDDIANYIPARLTAALMIIVSGRLSLPAFVKLPSAFVKPSASVKPSSAPVSLFAFVKPSALVNLSAFVKPSAPVNLFAFINPSAPVNLFAFVKQYGSQHASPNSGYPEAALAGILNCRFGGPNVYFGQTIAKPYIGHNPRELTTADMQTAIAINRRAELLMIALAIICIAVIGI